MPSVGLTISEISEAPWEESPGTPSPPNTGTTKCAPIILSMGESCEAPQVERPGTPSPPNTGNTKWIPIILPMGESGEAPRVERPGTPSPPKTGDTECVPGDTGSLHSQRTAHNRISIEKIVNSVLEPSLINADPDSDQTRNFTPLHCTFKHPLLLNSHRFAHFCLLKVDKN